MCHELGPKAAKRENNKQPPFLGQKFGLRCKTIWVTDASGGPYMLRVPCFYFPYSYLVRKPTFNTLSAVSVLCSHLLLNLLVEVQAADILFKWKEWSQHSYDSLFPTIHGFSRPFYPE